MATEGAAQRFFTSSFFAVAGASSNPAKYGHKVFVWYLDRELKVTPINPSSPDIEVLGRKYPAVPDVRSLPNPQETSLSVITPPAVTAGVLRDARAMGIRFVWLQPGSFDDEVLRVALEEGAFDAVLFGQGGRGKEGWCVLVDGDRALKSAQKL